MALVHRDRRRVAPLLPLRRPRGRPLRRRGFGLRRPLALAAGGGVRRRRALDGHDPHRRGGDRGPAPPRLAPPGPRDRGYSWLLQA
ncbi:MAG: hypothetical protein AVDCRST_MAG30-2482 [uncultured Solirubrobacteraceae bacterium]|uniref:Uncharacterized protein n=1 Tax=uncultured Solirubrobacteraceae bacterium TaxID=1162706 RepID=A0A6J4T1W2_9ACTN|nr:MAG: hypothetical protein AVDCRST_MAG30-2482 [uncultured Solirubrobacteraceae bacterium]